MILVTGVLTIFSFIAFIVCIFILFEPLIKQETIIISLLLSIMMMYMLYSINDRLIYLECSKEYYETVVSPEERFEYKISLNDSKEFKRYNGLFLFWYDNKQK